MRKKTVLYLLVELCERIEVLIEILFEGMNVFFTKIQICTLILCLFLALNSVELFSKFIDLKQIF